MESGNGRASSKGFVVSVPTSSDAFNNDILAPLKTSYLSKESERRFQYKSAFLIKNPVQEKRYKEFQLQKRENEYSDEDLKECYGFLLFEDFNKALAIAETGLITGNTRCSILGDPRKGIYISLYSDCLDLNPWYHGKSGCIAIIRLIRGRVKTVTENYTKNFTEPTQGFDCHMSEEFLTVSATTSSFLAFEKTQCYIYEQPDEGCKETIQCPRGASPFAIVTFSYSDTRETVAASLIESVQIEQASLYFPWRGKIQIGGNSIDVNLQAKEGAWTPVQLPPVLKIDQAIALSDLRQLLPKTVFETYPSGEVYLKGLHYSAFELISSDFKQTKLFSLLILEIKDKQLAPSIPLKDGGFLILLPSSLFQSYDGTKETVIEILRGLFVFPDSRLSQRDTNFQYQKLTSSSEILRVLPALRYAEGKVKNTYFHPREDLCGLIVLHMHNYSSLVHPGSTERPSQEIEVFPDIDVHFQKRPYLLSECTFQAWKNLKSYFKTPVLFQIPMSKAREIILDDKVEVEEHDMFGLPSSPQQTETNDFNLRQVVLLTGHKSAVHLERTLGTSGEARSDSKETAQRASANNFSQVETGKNTENILISRMIKTVNRNKRSRTPSTPELHHSTELIVSFTSAERALAEESRNNDEPSHFSSDKVKAMDDQTYKNSSEDSGLGFLTTSQSNELKQPTKVQKHVSRSCDETSSIQVNGDSSTNEESCGSRRTMVNKLRNTQSRKVPKRTLKKLFKNKEIRYFYACQKEKRSNLGQKSFGCSMDLSYPQKKMERWDLKPVVSECGKILVPHGHRDSARTKALIDKDLSRIAETSLQRKPIEATISKHKPNELDLEPIIAKEEAAIPGADVRIHKDEEYLSENAVINQVSLVHNVLGESVNEKDPLTLKSESSNHCTKEDFPCANAIQENLSSDNCVTKSDVLFSKLKSVLLRGKRKAATVALKDTAATTQGAESCFKKSKVDTPSQVLENMKEVSCDQHPDGSTREVPMCSVDPNFASALGLTPKQVLSNICAYEKVDSQQRNEPSDKEAQPDSEKNHVTQRFQPFHSRRGRIKALKKHQSISTELVKKNWWLHFQNLSSVDSADPSCNGLGEDNSDEKTASEKTNGASSSSDGLNLLADLALSTTSFEQVLPQQEQQVDGRRGSSLNKERESVLHALLRQPPARQIKPPERPFLNPVVGGTDLVCLIAKEHAYAFPQSTSMPLSLLVAPFQVSPLSGSTRLLRHHQTMNCEEIKPLHATAEQRDTKEFSQKDPELQKQHRVRTERFCRSRTFVKEDGCVQVTKHWKESYNFNFDSKFTNDSKYRAICRALHGPWDFSIQDTSEEVQLIFHMWIGLFYSRSTPRSFHLDSNCLNPYIKECDPLNVLTSIGQASTESFGPCLNVCGTSDALDLSKKDGLTLDLGSDAMDLSQKNALTNLHVEPQAKQRQTSGFDGLKEAGYGIEIAFESTTVQQKNLENTETSNGTCAHPQKKGSENNRSSPELHGPLDDHQEYKCGIDRVELTNNNGKNNINEHTKVEIRTMALLNKGDMFVQEVSEKTNIGQFENVDRLKVKKEEIQKGSEVFPQQRTKAEELRDNRDTENIEMAVKDDSMKSSSKSASPHFLTTHKNEKVKPVQKGSSVPLCQSIHGGEYKDLEIRDKEEKSVFQIMKKPSKKADVDDSKEQDVLEVKEKTSQMYPTDPSSTEIFAVKCKDGVNLEVKGKTAQEDIEVKSPQNDNVGKFSMKEQWSTGANLSVPLPSGNESMRVSRGEEQNADDDSMAQKNADLFVRKDRLNFNGADFTTDLEFDSSPTQLVSMTHDLDAVKNIYFTNTPCQTLLDQQTTTKDRGNCVLEFDKVCNSSHWHDDLVPQICTAECGVQAPRLKLSSHVTQDNNTLRNLQFKLLRAKGSSLMDQKAIWEKTPQDPNEIKSINERSSAIENSEREVMVSSSDEHIDKSTDQQEMLLSTNCSKSPKHNKSVFEAGMGSSVTDCEFTQAKEELEINYISPVNQSTGSYTPCKNAVQSHKLESEEKIANTRSLEDALISGTTNLKTLLPLSTGSKPLNYSEISGLPSTLQVTEKAEAKVLGREDDNHCPTPTMDEEPCTTCSNITSSNNKSCVTHLIGDENCGKILPVCPVKSSALIENSIPVRQQQISGGKDRDCFRHSQTDMEFKTQGVVQSIDKKRCVSTDDNLPLLMGNGEKIDIRHAIPDQNYASLEMYLNSQRPVIAVKPSKGDTQESYISQQSLSGRFLKLNYSECKSPPGLISLNKNMYEDINMDEYMQESSTDSAPCSLLSSGGVGMCATGTKFHQPLDTLHLLETNKISQSTKILPSRSPKCVEDTQQNSQTAREHVDMEKNSYSFASSPDVGDRTDCRMEYGFFLEPQNSLACTIFNTNNNRPESLLEKLSKRCIQTDPTQASMEQECLIFSEQMKQLLKRAKSGPIHQVEAHDKENMFCPSPVIVRFSDLEEVETEVGLFDEPSFVLPKIKMDISDRKALADTTGRETRQEDCTEPAAHTSVSGVTEECAILYTSMMNGVCGASKIPLRSNDLRVDKVLSRSQPSHHLDFCDQMKEEDHHFCNSMNSVVRKFCQAKYKFFILATSKNVIFEKTKVTLELEGHTAVQPSEFFLEDDSSTLIIVLRNEDIGEHICEVPNLLMLKKLCRVRFAGIDEPDDIVNLTHQELFVKGGFVVFDRAILETLSLNYMKKMSELFKELNRTGKWKWMLHYRDSRHLKENARFSAEAEERTHFIRWCQEVGILEVLPYHECDHLSREQPDYLSCMIRLQVQNISSRYSVFVTDKAEDSSFGKNGILTFTFESFLTCCPSKLFLV